MKKERARIGIGICAVSLIAAFSIYAVLLTASRKALSGFEKIPVLVSATEIPQGTELTAETLPGYLTTVLIDAGAVPSGACLPEEDLTGLRPRFPIEAGTLLCRGMFDTPEALLGPLEEPVLVGFRAEDLSQVAGGVLRSGDRICIYGEDKNTGAVTLRWENLYIAEAFDNSGHLLSGSRLSGNAVRFNVYLSKEDAAGFLEGLDAKTLRAVRVCE
ncbi:MAG: SAF domain-containing protein [Lachnospiraceae bacterium]|nr:SAF domain-containing protein [Lachnospiraceae bacterium]